MHNKKKSGSAPNLDGISNFILGKDYTNAFRSKVNTSSFTWYKVYILGRFRWSAANRDVIDLDFREPTDSVLTWHTSTGQDNLDIPHLGDHITG